MNQRLDVPSEAAGERADKFVARALPSYSRSFWQKQFAAGHIQAHGRPLKPSSPLTEGEVTVTLPSQAILDIELPIVYEDDQVLVINKPPGVLTHAKGAISQEATVADFVRPRTTDIPDSNRSGIVHRLDRDTSGILIAAKTSEATRLLQQQFAQRKVKKTYLALVEGRLEPPAAIIRLPIERHPKAPQKFRVGAEGKPAETTYQVLQYFPRYTFVELRPHTGRTHQLRVHLAHLGHPIVGDRVYGTPHKALPGRLFLHAVSLEITIPGSQRRVFTAPLPPELEAFLKGAQ